MAAAPAPAREPHLVSLKVLRAAKPSLAKGASPYSELESLAGPALAQLDHNSVRDGGDYGNDFSLSGAFILPSTFGTIYLGETFSAILCLSNDIPASTTVALSPVLKVEMHTSGSAAAPATSPVKHHLKTIYAPTDADALAPGESVEGMVQHEIKELGMHALVCTITYGATVAAEEGRKSTILSRSFRKVYKFQVSNPLSVRTKAHSANIATASSYLSPSERQKVFLEVQVQNQGEHALWFERLRFEPVPGWSAQDVNNLGADKGSSSSAVVGLFEGASALLPPNHVRQYLYVLSQPNDAPRSIPGSSQPLGRLDIEWRTPNGEVGHLQTSMLGRRVPQAPAPLNLPPGAPAVAGTPPPPPSLANTTVIPRISTPPRTSTPPLSGSHIRAPAPYRPSNLSPAPSSVGIASPPPLTPPPPPLPPLLPDATGLEFDLTVLSISPAHIAREVPLTITFHLAITDHSGGPPRDLSLAAQHVLWHDTPLPPSLPPPLRLPSQLASYSSPRTSLDSARTEPPAPSTPSSSSSILLPKPFPLPTQRTSSLPSRDILSLGPSLVPLPLLSLLAPSPQPTPLPPRAAGTAATTPPPPAPRVPARAETTFTMQFLPLARGLFRVGGVRVLLLQSRLAGGEEEAEAGARGKAARVVLEIDSVAEVWVRGEEGGMEEVEL